ncbi:MAG: choice-of-anchor L domain-containing protein [Bacteroidota bacterium]
MKKFSFFFFSLIIFSIIGHGQLTVTGGYTATQLAEILAGSNIVVSNATLVGDALSRGSFNGVNTNLGVSSGVILCTGIINDALGPNNLTNSSTDLGEPGTAQMTALAGVNTHDAITLQFDFEVQSDMIQFSYVFASEEYPEYAPPNNSSYNDVFAFFISGPGITGEENIALVPGSTDPVTINNINAITNNQLYIDNTGGASVQFDAFTTVMVAKKEGLIPCQTYTLKLVIADAGDAQWNSAVFLQENSLIQGIVSVQAQTINADDIALEGCVDASFEFSLDQPPSQDYQINFTITGSATNGIDYHYIDNTIIIPAGQTGATVIIDAIQDGFPEGQENIMLIYKPEICAEYDTVFLYIDDAQPIEFSLTETNLSCYQNSSGEILVNAVGGFPPYTYHVTDELGVTTLYPSNPVTGLSAGTYAVQVYDIYGCKADALVIGGIFDADTTFLPDGSGVSYTSTINIAGFPTGETIDNLSQLQQICANMEHSYLGDLQIKVIAPSGQSVILKQFAGGGSCDLGIPFASGQVDGSNSNLTDPGEGYDYCFNETPDHGTMVSESNFYTHTYPSSLGGGQTVTDNYLPAGSYISYQPLSNLVGAQKNGVWTLEVTDQYALDNGYIFNWNISLLSDLPDTIVVISEPQGIDVGGFANQANCGGNDGAVNINVNGLYPPFTYLWSNGATTEDLVNVPSGTYTVTVSDNNSCFQESSYIVSNISSLNITSVVNHINCPGASTGSINITVSGGTQPYSYLWNTGAITEDVNGLVVGTYTVTVTDNNNCVFIKNISVNQNPVITISLINSANETCGDSNGSVDIQVTGGSGSYGYLWSNGANTQDIVNLHGGIYVVTVTDGFGCTNTASYSIINNVSNCSSYCYLDISNSVIEDDICGSGAGEIDITIQDATTPYIVAWSNGSSIEDISNLVFGNYSVTINDAAGCQVTESFTVGNNTGTLVISNNQITSDVCGNGTGQINITVSGGWLPYSYIWSNNEISEDITGLSAGNYTVEVTDGNGCVLSQDFVVDNNTGNFQVSSQVFNEICNNNLGSINQTISGGFSPYTYLWSNSSVNQDISGLNSGTYICTVTDNADCVLITEFTIIDQPGSMYISEIDVTNEICDNNQGAIDIFVIGGNGGYSYSWSNSANTEDINNLSEGIYSCTITDGDGCQIPTGSQYIFNTGGNLEITVISVSDEICNNNEGYANISITGGDGNYTYLWSNGSTSQDLLNATAGNYTITVTDGNGCQKWHTITIENMQGNMNLVNSIVTDEICGNGLGQIDNVIAGGTTPYVYIWNNGATTQDISNLQAGNYFCTITDNSGCVITSLSTVNNQSSGMTVSNIPTNEICSDGSGSINLTVSGGALPYYYNWSNSATSEDISNLTSGAYFCQITDNNSCIINTGDIVINNNPGTLSVSANSANEICSNSSGSINLTSTGGSGNYFYQWNSGPTTEDISGLVAGNYLYTVTDDNACMVTGNEVIYNEPGSLILTSIQIDNELCNNNSGAIDITVAGGSGTIYYIWSNSDVTQDLVNLNEGLYSCTITDDTGCEITTDNIVVSNDPGTLELLNIQIQSETCDNNNGAVNITIQGGVAPITYLWNTGAITQDLTGLNYGNYTCTVTDANSCSLIIYATVNNSSGTLNVYSYVVTDETCDNQNGAIDISVQGGTIPYTYLWSNNLTTQDISGLNSGNYMCQVTDNNSCVIVFNTTVNSLGGNFVISEYSIDNELCGNSLGAIDITVSGGTLPYSFIWNNGSFSEDLGGLSNGTYSVTINDVYSCATQGTYNIISETGTLSIDDIFVSDENCGESDGAVDISYSGGYEPVSILWSNGSGDEDIEDISAGTYTITITDLFGCTATESAVVNNNSGGFAITSIDVVDELCGNALGSVDLSITGGILPYAWIWNTGATTEDLMNLQAGTYSCTITDNNDCKIIISETVDNITTGISLISASTQDDYCSNGIGYIDLVIQGGTLPYTYLWNSGAVTEDLAGINSGYYVCTITDASNCTIISDTYIIDNYISNLAVTATTVDDLCGNGTGLVNITPSGGFTPYSYNWSSGATYQDLTNISYGNYIVTVTDATGCELTNSYNIQFLNDINLQFQYINVTDDICGQGQGAIEFQPLAQGSYIYTLNGIPGSLPFPEFNNLTQGTYIVSIVENQCYVDSVIIIENIATFTSDLTNVINEDCGNGLGGIDISIAPTSATYYYNWNNGSVNQDIYNLHSGVYTCDISDDSGCHDVIVAEVLNSAVFNVSTTVTDENCGDQSGQISVLVTGATGVISYQWSTGAVTQDLINIGAGQYYCTITDEANCSYILSETVVNNAGSLISNETVYDDFCNSSQGYIVLDVIGGSGNYNILWNTGHVGDTLENLSAGTYFVTITDITSGCQFTDNYSVGNSGYFTVSNVVANSSCINCDDGYINLTINGSSPTYTFIWSNSAQTEDISNLLSGYYSVTVSDSWGCSFADSYTVGYSSSVLTLFEVISNDTCNSGIGYIELTISGGSGNYSYLWNTGDTLQNLSNLNSGIYSVTITDNIYGLILTDAYNIQNYVSGYTVATVSTDASCGICNDGSIDLTVTGFGIYFYNWSNGATTEDITDLLPGVYCVTISDGSGCEMLICDTVDYFVVSQDADNNPLSFSIYPNPTNGIISIDYILEDKEGNSIHIYNVLGELIYSEKINDKSGSTTIDLGENLPGVYYVTIKNKDYSKVMKVVLTRKN